MVQEANGLLTVGHELNVPLEAKRARASGQTFAGAASPLTDEGPVAERGGAS
jgi:hypothetical protein